MIQTRFALVAILAALGGAAFAQTTYFGEDINTNSTLGVNATIRGARTNADVAYGSFIASAPAYGQENFESYAGGAFPNGGSLSFPASGITGTLSYTSAAPAIELVPAAPATIDGGYSSSGSQALSFGFLNGLCGTIALSQPVRGFGLYITDAELIAPTITVHYTDATTQDFSVPVTVYPFPNFISGNIAFWGVNTTKPFNSIDLKGFGTAGNDRMFLDQMTVLVPEPSSLLVLAGAALLGLRRRR